LRKQIISRTQRFVLLQAQLSATNLVATLADESHCPEQGVGFLKAELHPTPLFTVR